MKLVPIVAAAGALALAASAHASTNLLVNGDFEATGFGGTTGYYNLGPPGSGADHPIPADFGWSVPVNNVDIVANGVYGPFLADGGAYSLDLVGYGSTGAISQTFNTVMGQTYAVSFEYSANNGVANPTASVTVDGVGIGTVTGGTGWQTFSGSFVGNGSPATFEIAETFGANNAGVFLDNIDVSAVPEPAAWALMIGGLGLMGAGLRARRKPAFAAA